MVEAMNLMGYDALALGASELSESLEHLRARMAEARFSVLSAHAFVEGRLLAEPLRVFELGSLRVAVVGLTAPEASSASVEVRDPIVAFREQLDRVRGASLVVALSNLGPVAEKRLAEAVPSLDLIIGGGSFSPTNGVNYVGTVALVRAGGMGEYVGGTEVRFGSGGEKEYEFTSVLLGPEYPDDPEMTALKTQYAEKYTW